MVRKLLLIILLSGLALSACAQDPTREGEDPSTPTAHPPASLRATPTVRVLQRADRPANARPAIVPADRDEVEEEDEQPNYEEAVRAARALPKVGSLAPDFTLSTLDRETVTLSELRGYPVLINFWASWCTACRAEAPELQQLYAEYQARGLVVLGVNVTQQDTVAGAQAYVNEFKMTFPVPMDKAGEVTKAYRVPGLPTTFFIDPEGIIRNVIMGQMNRRTMLESLDLIKSW